MSRKRRLTFEIFHLLILLLSTCYLVSLQNVRICSVVTPKLICLLCISAEAVLLFLLSDFKNGHPVVLVTKDCCLSCKFIFLIIFFHLVD